MEELVIHPHALKHGLSEDDIGYAWSNFVRKRPRDDDYWVAIGFDAGGREVEMVAAACADGSLLVIHANTPATKNVKRELGLERRQ